MSVDGTEWALLNASPDLRDQIRATPSLHPRTLRDSPIRRVLLTNGDVDHIAGLLTLREKQRFEIVTTAPIATLLDDSPIFRVLDPSFVTCRIIETDTSFELLPGLEARIFAVPGKVPLFMEGADFEAQMAAAETAPDDDDAQTVGVALSARGRRALYIPGCARITASLSARLESADLLLFDGTLFTDDEMIRSGTGSKTGRRMGHMPISGEGGSLEALSRLPGRKVYVHINNTNPIWRNGPERAAVAAAGIEVGHDGMEIVI